jgi:replicative DNA helicase
MPRRAASNIAFGALTVLDQVGSVAKRVNDPRGSIASGVAPLDDLLYRRGFQSGLFCIMGGRTHTRKTTVSVNLIARMLKAGRSVGFITLDETPAQYVLKLMSAMYGFTHETIEEKWNDEFGQKLQAQYLKDAAKLTITKGYRPTIDDLNAWLSDAEAEGNRPEVVFHDYGSLMARADIYGGETQRIVQMMENLQVWTKENELVTIMLHQLNRDGGEDGEKPVRLSDLKYGGEEMADIVFGTYRPALDEVGAAPTYEEARAIADGELKEEDWERRHDRVLRYQNSTMLQLIKNRPGTKLDKHGIELLSIVETMQMRTPSEGSTRETTNGITVDGDAVAGLRPSDSASQDRPREGAEA